MAPQQSTMYNAPCTKYVWENPQWDPVQFTKAVTTNFDTVIDLR